MTTAMWREIQEQSETARRVIEEYFQLAPIYNNELKSKKQVFLVGTGASFNACQAARYAFIKYNRIIPQVIGAFEIEYLVQNMGRDSLVILVSQSGWSYETQQAVEILKSKKVELWGITNDPDSVLARSSDRVLLMNAGREISSATKTYLASVLILYLLAAGNNDAALKDLKDLPDEVRQTLATSAETVAVIAEELKNEQTIYLVGMGMLGAAATQGALLLKEKALIHAEGMPLSEFRHGTVEVVSPGLPVIILSASPNRTGEAAKHADYVNGLGARVYLVGDEIIESKAVRRDRFIRIVNNRTEELSHLPLVIPLQLLAERIACQNGYDVDGFKHLTKVVDSY